MTNTILITGANGFLGRNLRRFLAQQGYNTHGLGRRRPDDERHPFSLLNIITEDSLRSVLAELTPSAVIHCAGVINGTPEEMKQGNEELTNLFVKVLEKDCPHTQFIHISSVSALEPKNAYGLSKQACEQIVTQSRLLRWTILRPALLYGPFDDKNIARLLGTVKKFPVVPVIGGRTVKLQPLYVDDVGNVIQKLLMSNASSQDTYTLAGPEQIDLWDIVGEIQEQLGKRKSRISIPLWLLEFAVQVTHKLFPILPLPVQQVSSLRNRQAYDISDAVREFHFTPRSFSRGLRDLLQSANAA